MTFDPEDTFGSGMSILFNEPEINIGDFGEDAKVEFPNQKPIELCIPDCEPTNTKLFAHHIWKASILLSKTLLGLNLEGKTVLELGAAAGIPSILCARMGAFVTASDYPDKDLILKLTMNMRKNIPHSNWRVVGHVWGETNDDLIPSSQQFDYILMADTLWMRHQHQNLLADLRHLLAPDGKILGVCGLHSGRDCIDAFFTDCKQSFKVESFLPTLIPIGNGFCIDKEWEVVDESLVIDTIPERNRFLFQYELSFQKTST
jgi:SAM-dependent methyltransferase